MRVLHSRKTRVTAVELERRLNRAIREEGSETLKRVENEFAVNWGGGVIGYSVITALGLRSVLNGFVVANKAAQHARLHYHDVPVSRAMFLVNMCDPGYQWYPGHHVIARKAYASQGKDYWVVKNIDDLNKAMKGGAQVGTIVSESKAEYRVHVVNRKSVKISEKVHPEFGLLQQDWQPRSHRLGWQLRYPHSLPPGDVRDRVRVAAKDAVAALGYEFGAVDVLLTTHDEPLVLEVNSAPGLEAGTMGRYVKGLMGLLEGEVRYGGRVSRSPHDTGPPLIATDVGPPAYEEVERVEPFEVQDDDYDHPDNYPEE